MLIVTHQKLSTVGNFMVMADNINLTTVGTFKYLGIILDQTLSWKDHVSSLGKKISSRLGMLSLARKVLPRHTCLTLYNAMILPLFDYCAPVWDSCGVGSKDYLNKLNRRAACIIEGSSVGIYELLWNCVQLD